MWFSFFSEHVSVWRSFRFETLERGKSEAQTTVYLYAQLNDNPITMVVFPVIRIGIWAFAYSNVKSLMRFLFLSTSKICTYPVLVILLYQKPTKFTIQ